MEPRHKRPRRRRRRIVHDDYVRIVAARAAQRDETILEKIVALVGRDDNIDVGKIPHRNYIGSNAMDSTVSRSMRRRPRTADSAGRKRRRREPFNTLASERVTVAVRARDTASADPARPAPRDSSGAEAGAGYPAWKAAAANRAAAKSVSMPQSQWGASGPVPRAGPGRCRCSFSAPA